MLNKKTLFNGVYALALFGAITSCIGILNEFLNLAQLYDVYVIDAYEFVRRYFWVPFFFYLITFVICTFAVTLQILFVLGKHERNRIFSLNISIIASCAIVFLLSLIFVYILRGDNHSLEYFEYLINYTFRSGVMSFIASMGVILICNIIEIKSLDQSAAADDVTQ